MRLRLHVSDVPRARFRRHASLRSLSIKPDRMDPTVAGSRRPAQPRPVASVWPGRSSAATASRSTRPDHLETGNSLTDHLRAAIDRFGRKRRPLRPSPRLRLHRDGAGCADAPAPVARLALRLGPRDPSCAKRWPACARLARSRDVPTRPSHPGYAPAPSEPR